MAAYDLKRELKSLYAPKNTDWDLLDVPPQQFLAIDGRGDPNTAAAYTEAVEALYSVAYTIKFACKRGEGGDFTVGPLEGLWWSDRPEDFTARAKSSWQWRMLICQPAWVDAELIEAAKATAQAKKRLPAIARIEHHALEEGLCAQVLHRGSYDDEGPTLADLHRHFMPDHGLAFNGLHHEIYLSDPRRVTPEKLKTVLRQPVRKT
ncbi:GyrI-like domain-containing protein [Glycomyces buryatensis]|uniref:GyrI-like small molecule binding domain-containing protein n=1 Tax=Glycomyces buryatensis TaxID=2570927 RepID=A0A4S8PQZ7_9ACTN|nr:GyrI-like domain-containing protein [Glycomyces buryatensis]THV33623.1 hypothetical protein FAB82_26170 [Glycomyces buryatensis]